MNETETETGEIPQCECGTPKVPVSDEIDACPSCTDIERFSRALGVDG